MDEYLLLLVTQYLSTDDALALSNTGMIGLFDMFDWMCGKTLTVLLNRAAQGGHVTIVNHLILSGASIDQLYNWAFHIAVKLGHEKVVEVFLNEGVYISRFSDALRMAVKYGHGSITKMLLERGVVYDNRLLQLAVRNNHVQIVYDLCQFHADKNDALCIAASCGYDDMVIMLLELGANPHHNEDYPIWIADESGHFSTSECIRRWTH